MSGYKYPILKDKSWLEKRLADTPTRRLAKEIGCHYSAINHAIRKFGIKVPYRNKHIYDPGQTVWNKGKHPEYMQGPNHHNWGGGRRRFQGYILIWTPKHPHANQGYVFEHRLVIEASIGRYLEPKEVVHHKNGIKDDNRLENLELMSSHEENTKAHFDGFRILTKENSDLKEEITKLKAELAKYKP